MGTLSLVPISAGFHCWLVQQWATGICFVLLGKPAVAPVSYELMDHSYQFCVTHGQTNR